ncbi:MAG: hypothetical protein K2P78_12900 [Gemmataceae bacterium]|nr:hypothetical protein [Gemmataceae bacterium]
MTRDVSWSERGTFSVAWSPDGKALATGGIDHDNDGTVFLWDLAALKRTPALKGHRYAASSVAWRPDGKALASASDDATVRVWVLSNTK